MKPTLLTVVIPAYKPDFLSDALQSLAAQSIKDFEVLVADDCSPHALEDIARRFEASLRITYHRFADNMGGKSLATQWSRSVRLTNSPWVWLFADDDIADPNCVEVLLTAFKEPVARTIRLFHFNTRIIDHAGQLIRETPRYPSHLSAAQFVRSRMAMRYSSFACEYVFSRAAFEEIGGFVDFPTGWCSDDASWVALAGHTDIVTPDGAMLSWRRSEKNISSSNSGLGQQKADAMVSYVEWLIQRGLTGEPGTGARWFLELLGELDLTLGLKRCLRAAKAISKFDGDTWLGCASVLLWRDLLHVVKRIKSWFI